MYNNSRILNIDQSIELNGVFEVWLPTSARGSSDQLLLSMVSLHQKSLDALVHIRSVFNVFSIINVGYQLRNI